MKVSILDRYGGTCGWALRLAGVGGKLVVR